MPWVKRGLVYNAQQHHLPWADNAALTPTPVVLNNAVIRVYAGFRDRHGVSRIGYIDLDADDPMRVLQVSQAPALDVGRAGAFDDNGVILGDIIQVENQLHMFYVGFQLTERVKFLAFSGLAISHDGGLSFNRCSSAPLMDRSDEGLYIRAIHSVHFENGVWKIWYATGNEWAVIDGKPFPDYQIRYLETRDLLNMPKEGQLCIPHTGNEYRIGRPRVYKDALGYKMYYTKGSLDKSYLPGYAESKDGACWTRMDDQVGIHLSDTGWDSVTLCYPSLLKHKGRVYMFYNGNNMGENGFGCAEFLP